MEEIGYSRISLNLQSVHTPLQSFPRHALSSPPSPPSLPPPSFPPPPPSLPLEIPTYTPSSSPPSPMVVRTLHNTGRYHPSCLSSISILTFNFPLLPLYSLSGCFPFFSLFVSYLIFSFSTFSTGGFLFPYSHLPHCMIFHVFLICSFSFPSHHISFLFSLFVFFSTVVLFAY